MNLFQTWLVKLLNTLSEALQIGCRVPTSQKIELHCVILKHRQMMVFQ